VRIIIFSLAYRPFIGGAEVALEEIVSRLPEHKYDIITVNLDGRQLAREQVGSVTIHRLGRGKISKYFFPFFAWRYARELQRKKSYDLSWAMMANQAGLAALFFKFNFPAVPYLLTLQEGDSEWDIWLRTWWLRPVYKNIYRRADRIQAISNFLAERARRLGYHGQIDVVPNGIAENFFRTTDRERTKTLISVSRLVKKNGVADIIRSLQLLSEYKLILVGDGDLRRSLESLASELGVDQRIEFVGSIPANQVADQIARADIFIRPSLSEGLGSAFLEAMAGGVPVIATNVGGIGDIVRDKETGWIVPVGDNQAIATAVEDIFVNWEKSERIIAQARELAERHHWQDIAERMNDIFQSTKK